MGYDGLAEAVCERGLPDLVDEHTADVADFDALYARHSAFVYNTCLGILGNPDDARDAMQETFVQVFRSLPSFRGQSALSTWVYRIAVNKCYEAARRRPGREAAEALEWFREAAAPTRDHVTEQRVREIILKLKPDQRAVLVLYHFQGLSYTEIAETLRCSLDLVRTRLHRARKVFRKLYEEDGKDEA